MLLTSIELEKRFEIIEKIRNNTDIKKIDIFILNDLEYNFNYSKYDYIVTEYNEEIIDYFLNKNKKIIIYNYNNSTVNSLYLNNKKIIIFNNMNKLIQVLKDNQNFKRKKIYILLLVLIILIIALVGIFIISNTRNDNNKKILNKQRKEIEIKNKVDYSKENYVFLGDSIIDFYDLKKYYKNLPVVNSGISGNQYKDLLDNLPERVYKYNPTKVFILIGTNDIAFTEITNEELVDRIIEICDNIHNERKKTEIYVESIYPVNRNTEGNDIIDLNMVLRRYNDRIQEINTLLKEKVLENNYNYIDMYSILADENGDIKLEYTVDGLHMSDEGYKVITKKIMSIINK